MRLPTAALLLLSLGLAGGAAAGSAPSAERRVYETRRAPSPPTLDGILDDAAWELVAWEGDFVQRDPKDGAPPSKPTQFKVVYDDAAVYFAIRAYDDPGAATRLLARRDWFPGDWVEVNIDSYNDRRTAFSFTLSLSGTRGDEFISEDGQNWDKNWDPVWEGATHVDDEGWTAEMRIPLSQLRFSGEAVQTWGLQVQRRLFRHEERSTWQPIPKDVSGWVSRFGELRGIEGIEPRRRFELLPYAVARTERYAAEPGNPFQDGSGSGLSAGLDGKLGITSDLTLDFTVNPDFGQVEADPSEVNLSAFETFFAEKRPFFIEGNSILKLNLAPAVTGGSFTQDTLFYSRRIGGAPSYSPDLADGEFADEPDTTSILGAFKLSGKTSHGLSIGVLNSVTGRETAPIDLGGQRRPETVEPLTNYFVGRVQQDFRGGQTQVGAMLTSVVRDIDSEPLGFLTTQAWAGGMDFTHYFHDRDYLLEGNLLASRLSGSAEAIDEAQTSSARYFQRPDNDYVDYDPTRTGLGGHAGSLRLRRTNNSPFVFQTGVAWRSPGFEINDLGYMRRADELNHFTWAGYYWRNPFSVFRSLAINYNHWLNWDFGGNFLSGAVNMNSNAHFKNNYRVGAGVTHEGDYVSNNKLRGGPSSKWPGNWAYSLWLNSDSRRKLWLGAGAYTRQARDEDYKEAWLDLTFRPANALSVALSPVVVYNRTELQYVDTPSFGADDRYVFGSLDQRTFSLVFRLDFCIKPNLTLQYYGSPFVSSGRYEAFKQITAPRAETYEDRFGVYDAAQIAYDATREAYDVDENRDGRVDYSFDRPDFDSREFNSTLVLRWEYRPGSLLYVVWSQARSDDALRPESLLPGRGVRQVFDAPPHNVFLVKFSKWFSM